MTAPNQTALAVASSANTLPVKTMADAMQLGELFERSALFGTTQQGQGTVLVLTCLSEGISPLKFSQTYHIIEGRVAMKSDAMLAKFVERGGEYIIEERSATRAAATFIKGKNTLKQEVTMEQAKASGLALKKDGKVKEMYVKFPAQMLWARLCSDSIRAIDPGVCAGIYTPEEVQDFPDTPQTVAGASRRIESAPADDPAPEVLAPEPPLDVTVCPFGPKKGTKWEDLPLAALEAIVPKRGTLAAYGMTDQHHDAVEAEIGRRQQQPAKEG